MTLLTNCYPGDAAVQWWIMSALAATAVAGAARLMAAAWPRDPAARHAVLWLGLCGVLACPALALVLPQSGLSFVQLPTAWGQSDASASPPRDLPESRPAERTGTAVREGAAARTAVSSSPDEIPRAEATLDREPAPARWLEAPRLALTIGLLLWCVVSSVLALRWLLGAVLWLRLQRRCEPLTDKRFQGLLREAALQTGSLRLPELLVSDDARTPLAMGWLRPQIVLPRDLLDRMRAEEARDILVHELAHLVRGDQYLLPAAAVARIFFWPTVAVPMLLNELARAREEVCDNYALQGREPLAYAETLFKVAEWSCDAKPPPATVGVMHWRGKLEQRIAGILDPRRSDRRRVRPLLTGACGTLLALLACLFCGVTFAERPAAPLSPAAPAPPASPSPAPRPHAKPDRPAAKAEPTVDSLIAGLRAAEAKIRNLSVTTSYVKHQCDFLPVEDPVRLEMVTRAIVDQKGRSWSDTVGEQVNIEPNGKDIRIYKGHWRYAFDGKVARSLEGGAEGPFRFASISFYTSWHGMDPREFTTHYSRRPVSEILAEKKARIHKQEVLEGRRVTVVDTTPSKVRMKYRFWIDARRMTINKRALLLKHADEKKWREYTRIESKRYLRINGVWVPMRIKYESLRVPPGKPSRLSWRYEGVNRDWKVNQTLPMTQFTLTFPDGVYVNDHRPQEQKAREARKRREEEKKKKKKKKADK